MITPSPLSVRVYLSGSRTILFGIGVTVFAMFLPTLIVPYGFSDDYLLLAMVDRLGLSDPGYPKSIIAAAAVNGRPFAGLLDTAFFSAAGTIDNLRFIRFVGVVGIVLLALVLHWALVRSGIRRAPAALIAVLVCSMPAFQVYGSWADLFLSPYAALLGGVASLLAVAALDAPGSLMLDRLVGAGATLLAALLIYQPAAMFFWVFLAVALVGAVHDSSRLLHVLRAHLGVAAVALPLAYLVVKLGVHEIGATAPNAARNTLTHDLSGKVHWFFQQPLYRSLNLFELTPTPWLAALVAAVAAGGILLALRHQGARALLYAGVAAVLVPLSYLPNLVVAENFATFRTQVSLSALIALYVGLGALGIWLALRDWVQPRVSGRGLIVAERLALTALTAFVATSAFSAARNVTTLFVDPQMTELRLIRSQVATFPAGVPRVAFVQTAYYEGMTKLVLNDEFGLPSSADWYTAEPLVLLTLREEGRLRPGAHPTVDRLPSDTATLPKSEPVVDVRGLQRLR